MIQITKLGRRYMARVTPPEAPKAKACLMPMDARETVEWLIRHGCHLQEAFDAMFVADPAAAAAELR
jgi:hypothetical protein